MVAGTSGADRALRIVRATQHFGRLIVVGGGCYGSYYVRQLTRAHTAGAATWSELVVVDRDPACLAALLPDADRPPGFRVEVAEWSGYFERYLADTADGAGAPLSLAGHAPGARDSEQRLDVIVPSPLMPHLMADWLLSRARRRWPTRRVDVAPLDRAPVVPWERAGEDGTHYVSFADWMCPINCIEPARCPHTKGERTWSMPTALALYAEDERAAGRDIAETFVFHCTHRTHGVGMIDVRDVVAADLTIAAWPAGRDAVFLIGTASHCHGAIRRVLVSG